MSQAQGRTQLFTSLPLGAFAFFLDTVRSLAMRNIWTQGISRPDADALAFALNSPISCYSSPTPLISIPKRLSPQDSEPLSHVSPVKLSLDPPLLLMDSNFHEINGFSLSLYFFMVLWPAALMYHVAISINHLILLQVQVVEHRTADSRAQAALVGTNSRIANEMP